ncbi:hypothetical protein TWF718_005025 [Orbilia javanica]|uniref:Uncharacterized protein n=1 Tax=Orbilia javanica TaxID=47235 RepID=A0AAN8RFF7_9PEZI
MQSTTDKEQPSGTGLTSKTPRKATNPRVGLFMPIQSNKITWYENVTSVKELCNAICSQNPILDPKRVSILINQEKADPDEDLPPGLIVQGHYIIPDDVPLRVGEPDEPLVHQKQATKGSSRGIVFVWDTKSLTCMKYQEPSPKPSPKNVIKTEPKDQDRPVVTKEPVPATQKLQELSAGTSSKAQLPQEPPTGKPATLREKAPPIPSGPSQASPRPINRKRPMHSPINKLYYSTPPPGQNNCKIILTHDPNKPDGFVEIIVDISWNIGFVCKTFREVLLSIGITWCGDRPYFKWTQMRANPIPQESIADVLERFQRPPEFLAVSVLRNILYDAESEDGSVGMRRNKKRFGGPIDMDF